MYRDSFLVNKIKKALPIPVFEASDIPMCILDVNGTIVTVNSAFTALSGYTRIEMTGKSIEALFDERDKEKEILRHTKFIENDNFDKCENHILTKNNIKITTYETNIKFADADGKNFRLLSFVDVSRKRNGEYLKSVLFKISQIVNRNEDTDKLFEDVYGLISRIIPADNFVIALRNEKTNKVEIIFNNYAQYLHNPKDFNSSLSVMVNYLIGRKYSELIDATQINDLIDRGEIQEIEKIPQLLLSVPISIKDEIVGLVLAQNYTDPEAYDENKKQMIDFISEQFAHVIERKRYQQELIEAKRKAEESERVKTNFLSQMSHEVRTPLNSILSFTSLIREEIKDKIDPELQSYFSMVERGGNRLIRTFELILNVSGIQKGEYKPEFSNVFLIEDVIQPLIERLQKRAANKGIELNLIKQTSSPFVNCDFSSMNQIIIHLVENAIKFTTEGKVDVIVRKNSNNCLQIDVKDTGIGISDEFLPKIFEDFSQEETGYTRSFEGNGLGLSLVKAFADINKVKLKVKSKKNKGSTFSIIFPCEK